MAGTPSNDTVLADASTSPALGLLRHTLTHRPLITLICPSRTLVHVKNVLRFCLGLLFIVATSWLPAPAQACACGALVTDSSANINAETAFVVMTDGRERIDMVMHLDGEASAAAWIMPLPPGGKVSLGDKDVFGRLKKLTAPRPRHVLQFLPDFRSGGPQAGTDSPAGQQRRRGQRLAGGKRVPDPTRGGTNLSGISRRRLADHRDPIDARRRLGGAVERPGLAAHGVPHN